MIAAQEFLDYAIERDGKLYAGVHKIVDMWAPRRIDDLEFIETALRESVAAARATLLHIHLHHFDNTGGVSGVAVLAESHISVHTWPERGFAAFDVFTCGNTDPEAAIAVLTSAFQPERVEVCEILRGGTE
ncbi:MAG: adenosylmethionine decarboxylase [Proteobacteria bacterium]|nr:adenosylmethionine decarboxylase [Pseudomonadota bacterium]MDA1357766.1 adenosylmethionine decarboxylase [Pseudomonadota bacterium]